MRGWRPGDRVRKVRTRRALMIAGGCSVLFHVLLAALMFLGVFWGPQQPAKKGEPLFVDIAPDKPDEKAPLGDPSRPPSPPPAREAARPPAPKAEPKVRVAEAPRPAPPAPAPAPPKPAPAPPQVAKAPDPPAPKAPEAPAPVQQPTPAPQPTPTPRETPPTESAQPASPASQPAPQGPMTARSSGGIDLPAAMLRRPPGGGRRVGAAVSRVSPSRSTPRIPSTRTISRSCASGSRRNGRIRARRAIAASGARSSSSSTSPRTAGWPTSRCAAPRAWRSWTSTR